MNTQATEQYVRIERTFDAPRDLVWQAWIDPDQLAQWWGPEMFHAPSEGVDIDLRPGGHFHLSMVEDASGTEYPVRFDVVEVVEHELLVFSSPAQPELGLTTDTTTRVEFSDVDGRTRMTVVDGPYVGPIGPNAEMGWNQQIEKLARLLTP